MQILLTFRSSRLLTHPLTLAFRPNRQVDRICAGVSVAVTRCLWSNYNHSHTYWPHTSVGANIDVGWTFTVSRDQRTPPDDRYPLTYRRCSVRVGSQKDRSGNLCHLKNVRLVVFSCLDLKIKTCCKPVVTTPASMPLCKMHGLMVVPICVVLDYADRGILGVLQMHAVFQKAITVMY